MYAVFAKASQWRREAEISRHDTPEETAKALRDLAMQITLAGMKFSQEELRKEMDNFEIREI